jgi:hypothetical protein
MPNNFFGQGGTPGTPNNFFGALAGRPGPTPQSTLVFQYDSFGDLPPLASVSEGTVALVKDTRSAYEAGPGAWLLRGAFAGSNVHLVEHGDDANVARPSGFAAIWWKGSVNPLNALNGDFWFDTSGL